ncbi:MAG: cupin domain-containing protein [Lachnospiraceae bacterium]|nr:cupin domain-containing protein [Lachnospiraceae bacterium]
MRKRRLTVFITAAALSLSACSGSQTQESNTAQTSQQTAAAEIAGVEAADGTENSGEPGAEREDAQENEQDSAGDWASRAIEEGKVSSMEELTFPIGEQVSGTFTGAAFLAPMIMNDETYHFPQTNNVTFEPGARSYWHSHGGMILVGTGGVGYYQEEGKPVQIIRKGDVVECPEGVRHWHGAAPDNWFSQMVIYDSHYTPESEAPEAVEVSDEEYENLEFADYTPQVAEDNEFMFQKADTALESDTFNGPAYVSNIIGEDNVAGAPGLHYVVFNPGVINNWHTHEGGQILIATDGIGYHQIEGEPVQVLYPGDVALCPPGEKHWHGGSADTSFAHIAVNTNPELTGLEWFDRISNEEYAGLPSEKPEEAQQ